MNKVTERQPVSLDSKVHQKVLLDTVKDNAQFFEV